MNEASSNTQLGPDKPSCYASCLFLVAHNEEGHAIKSS
jgi:hypothetical protein